MKKIKRIIKPLLFVLLSSLLAGAALFFLPDLGEKGDPDRGSAAPPAQELAGKAGGEALAYKNESVYVVLDPEGRVIDQRIVNRIYRSQNEAAAQIKDYGDYRSINNMTSEAAPTVKDKMILWDSNLLREGDIYYEGVTDKELPVTFQIEYYLEGKKIKPAALPGKSGRLRIVIKMKNNLVADGAVTYRDYHGKIARKQDDNYVPLLVQGTYTADLNRFSDIAATDGAGIITGQYVNVSFMAFPYPEAEVILTMTGKDIELNQIMLMILPQLPPIPEVDMEDDLREMLDGVTAIEEGLTALYEGADQIYEGLDQFRNKSNEMMAMMEPLLSLLEEWQPFIDEHLPEYKEIRSHLERLRDYLEDLPDFEGSPDELPGEMPGLPDEIPEIPELPELPELPETEELIASLESMKELLEEYDDLEGVFSEAENTFEQLAMLPDALNQLADGQKALRDGLGEINERGIKGMKEGLIDGINENRFGSAKIELMRSLAEDYRSHADNQNNEESSVQFIIQTEGENQKDPAGSSAGEKQNEEGPGGEAWYIKLWTRFLALFGR